MCDVVCPFKDRCSDYSGRCWECSNNSGKRSYFSPKYTPLPYYPYYPYPYTTPIWCSISSDNDGSWMRVTTGTPTTTPSTSYFTSM